MNDLIIKKKALENRYEKLHKEGDETGELETIGNIIEKIEVLGGDHD